jgi:hypothetical protein
MVSQHTRQVMTRLTLVLAHAPDKPDGDLDDRLILDLKLNSQGQIDLQGYETAPAPWLAHRQHNGATPRPLEVIRVDEAWALQSTDSLDDPITVFEGHVYRPGELVRLRRPDGQELLYRIVASSPSPPCSTGLE